MKKTIAALFIAGCLGSAWAQPAPSQSQAAPPAATATEKRVTYSFTDQDLTTILKILAKDMGVSIYIDPSVMGSVTIELVDVPVSEAIRRVLAQQQNPYAYKVADGPMMYMVVAPPDKIEEAMASHTFAVATQFNEYAVGQATSRNPSGTAPPSPPTAAPKGLATLGVGYNGPSTFPAGAESYEQVDETGYREVSKRPLSTFSIDVDTASYANVRRFLNDGSLPPADAVRVEELINYFRYDYPQPKGKEPFSVTTELSQCPWNSEHQLLRVGLQGKKTEAKKMPPRNLVFLLDVSGSMSSPDKLPLVKRAMQMLLATMGKDDHVAIVVYAGDEGLALDSTSCDEKGLISEKIESLESGGSTNGSAGIVLAYETARKNFREGAINRVVLCTDGDFNVGLTGGSLDSLIEKEREHGIFLTVLGFGTGNIKDDTMESLADKGNGNYAYIDSVLEAQKVLVREAGSTLETIAKDVKLQIEFNPKRVHSYRLVGYENRRLEDEDFANDKKDAGELGAGHNVTALYELVTDGKATPSDLRYQETPSTTGKADSDELALVKLRYKEPTGDTSKLIEMPISDKPVAFAKASQDLRFAASVAAFGMVLRDSEYKGQASLTQVKEWAAQATGKDPNGDRHEFLKLVELAGRLKTVDGTK